MLTSAAPVSTTKLRIIALLIRTGTTYVPPFSCIGIWIDADDRVVIEFVPEDEVHRRPVLEMREPMPEE